MDGVTHTGATNDSGNKLLTLVKKIHSAWRTVFCYISRRNLKGFVVQYYYQRACKYWKIPVVRW